MLRSNSVPKIVVGIAMCATLTACNSRSTPWASSVPIHNGAALDFINGSRPVPLSLGDDLAQPDFTADDRIVGIAVSGGGMRATAFTLGILAEIDDARLGRMEHVDFISSNSGGSWAVAAMLRAKHERPQVSLPDSVDEIQSRLKTLNKGRIKCFEGKLKSNVLGDITFGQLYPKGAPPQLPLAYFNASLIPSQTGFVFSQSHAEALGVTKFRAACERDDEGGHDFSGSIKDLPIGFAAATSGSVPSFSYSYAETKLCDTIAPAASFCRRNAKSGKLRSSSRPYLQLVDGGLYDNIGYKTAFELVERMRAETVAHRGMVFINSSPDVRYHSIPKKDRHSSHGFTILREASFATQEATFARMREGIFAASGVPRDNQVLLDFASTANLTDSAETWKYLDDLPTLAHQAANAVNCYDDNGNLMKALRSKAPDGAPPPTSESIAKLRRAGIDCLTQNFARVGYLYKTTYYYDPYLFQSTFELGRLAARLHADEIRAALGN